MQAQLKPVPFSLVSCSSEDQEFPARSVIAGASSRGWRTHRGCSYPQELVVRLEPASLLAQIQILAHENRPGSDASQCTWKPLGTLTYASNEKSGFQARELKSATFPAEHAGFLRLVVHGAYANQYNRHGQASIVALNLAAKVAVEASARQEAAPAAAPDAARPMSAARDQPMMPPKADTSGLDEQTAAEVKQLDERKRQAVVAEDYDAAKALKQKLDRLKTYGQRIAELEARKKQAVGVEDYDAAKSLKTQIDALRQQAADSPSTPRGGGGPLSARASRPAALPGISDARDNGSPVQQPSPRSMLSPGRSPDPPTSARGRQDAEAEEPVRRLQRMTSSAAQQYDDRPAMARGGMGPDPDAPSEQPPEAEASGPLGAPEPLSAAAAKDAGDIPEVLGTHLARCLYSKSWQLREAALQQLLDILRAPELSSETWRAALQAEQRAVKDKVASVVQAGFTAFGAQCDLLSQRPKQDAAALAELMTPVLVEKTGDANPRNQSSAQEALERMARTPQLSLASQSQVLLKPLKNQAAWKPVLARLKLLQSLAPVLGVGAKGLPPEGIMKFAGAAMASANADTRAAALAVAVQVHQKIGPAVLKMLPADVNAKLREQLVAAAGEAAPGSPADAQARGRQGPGEAPQQPRPGGSRQPSPPVPPLSALPSAEEPASQMQQIQAELAVRERELGPDHVEVAEYLSNLAILHNQAGEGELAQPLYERALAIWERHYGPDHPDVAHTLTDLAVLHLEQGREEQGRPLLERALRIQEAALGPDHPDVVAIRDVLLTEG